MSLITKRQAYDAAQRAKSRGYVAKSAAKFLASSATLVSRNTTCFSRTLSTMLTWFLG